MTVQLDGAGRQLSELLATTSGPGAPAPDDKEVPVFVDDSGRRSRTFRRIGVAVGMACAAYAVVVVATLLSGNSSAPWLPMEAEHKGPAGQVDTEPLLPADSATPTASPGDTPSPGVSGSVSPGASTEPGASTAPATGTPDDTPTGAGTTPVDRPTGGGRTTPPPVDPPDPTDAPPPTQGPTDGPTDPATTPPVEPTDDPPAEPAGGGTDTVASRTLAPSPGADASAPPVASPESSVL
ncbi:hypothetical protein [Streptomyces sp. NPDC050145]|uniref:hypothetical protein n=1 Tax=Streptomyces sp. NPDC050145 TaxID=3365602 RepID=UPI003799F32D